MNCKARLIHPQAESLPQVRGGAAGRGRALSKRLDQAADTHARYSRSETAT